MVGMLGCGCCEAPELCPAVNYLKTFSDDFSPDFEPNWRFEIPSYHGNELIARDGVCSLRGNIFPNSVYSQGLGLIDAEQKTISGNIEVSLKIVDFPVNELSTGLNEIARAAIGIWSPAESTREMWFEAINIESQKRRGFNFRDIPQRSVSGYSTLGLQYFVNRIPQIGDVIKIILSNGTQDPFYLSDITYSSVKAYVNNQLVFTYPYSFRVRKCDFDNGMWLHQFRFIVQRTKTNPGVPYHPQMVIIKTDDFNFQSL